MREEYIDNPRYPHNIKIVRMRKRRVPSSEVTGTPVDPEDPLADQDADVLTDSDGGGVVVEEYEDVLYDDEGRAYTDTTTTGDNTTDMNKRKASIPVRYDEWDAEEVPLDGDTIVATMGNYVERGIVKDCEPDNNRTVVYWEYVRV